VTNLPEPIESEFKQRGRISNVRDLPKTLDVVTSGLNEEECIPELYRRITIVLEQYPEIIWRLIICDNGSTDNTWKIITDLSQKDSRVIGLRLARTFSFDNGLTCGLDHAEAEVVILMASDLQDPPEVFKEFLDTYRTGFDQVVARIIRKNHVPLLRRILSKIFYKIANTLTKNMIPKDVSDFRLLSRSAYVAARSLRERNRFLRGLIAWTGFNTAYVEIDRPERFAGNSVFLNIKLLRIIQWASNAIFSHTSLPLELVTLIGIVSSILSALATFIFSLIWLINGVPFAGYGTIVGLLSVGFSLVLLSIGILAQYLSLIYEEVKQRPLYVISEKIGL
jgi:glycosyltransferase involved in cell wall biosynthesis